MELNRNREEVLCMRASSDNVYLAVGYSDGVVEIFNLRTKESVCTFSIHKSAVTCLRFDVLGLKLLSGGNDTDVVVSDIVSQTGLHRLSGHTGPITDTCFMEKQPNVVISSSKDSMIKFWNMETQFCFKTIVDHRAEVWGITLMRGDEFLVAGSKESSLKVYKLIENKAPTFEDDEASPFRYEKKNVSI